MTSSKRLAEAKRWQFNTFGSIEFDGSTITRNPLGNPYHPGKRIHQKSKKRSVWLFDIKSGRRCLFNRRVLPSEGRPQRKILQYQDFHENQMHDRARIGGLLFKTTPD